MTVSPAPDLADVLAARQRIAPYLRPTPLYHYPALDALTGARVRVKHENHQPVGAFKVRGGVNLVSQLSAGERDRGVITRLLRGVALQVSPPFVITEDEIGQIAEVFTAAFDTVTS